MRLEKTTFKVHYTPLIRNVFTLTERICQLCMHVHSLKGNVRRVPGVCLLPQTHVWFQPFFCLLQFPASNLTRNVCQKTVLQTVPDLCNAQWPGKKIKIAVWVANIIFVLSSENARERGLMWSLVDTNSNNVYRNFCLCAQTSASSMLVGTNESGGEWGAQRAWVCVVFYALCSVCTKRLEAGVWGHWWWGLKDCWIAKGGKASWDWTNHKDSHAECTHRHGGALI